MLFPGKWPPLHSSLTILPLFHLPGEMLLCIQPWSFPAPSLYPRTTPQPPPSFPADGLQVQWGALAGSCTLPSPTVPAQYPSWEWGIVTTSREGMEFTQERVGKRMGWDVGLLDLGFLAVPGLAPHESQGCHTVTHLPPGPPPGHRVGNRSSYFLVLHDLAG